MNIAVFCASQTPRTAAYRDEALALGRLIAQKGHTLVYGGSNLGLMGAVSGAALEQHGRVIGIIPTLFSEAIIASQPVTELVRVSSMAERKERILALSDVFIALPGGIGTIDEVSEVLVSNQLLKMNKPMVIVNTCGFYNPLLQQFATMRDEGLLRGGVAPIAVGTALEAMQTLSV